LSSGLRENWGEFMEIGDYFYTENQAAQLLGINRITIWRWIKNGKFNAQHIGGIVLIPKWEVELLKTKQKVRV
jgi:excisionase family DNA binding protein